VAKRGSSSLLGGQIAGMEGSANRIGTPATALHAGIPLLSFGFVEHEARLRHRFSTGADRLQT